jgi:glycosyltransferase involved in cell wall biosynthesis
MNIVFLTLGYPVDINARNLYTDLMTSFVKLGHNVSVFRQDEEGNKTCEISDSGVKVFPVYTGKVTKTSFIKKGINLLLLENKFYNAVRTFCRDEIDLLLYSTPPITFCNAIKKIKKHYNCTTYLLLKDIFPQNAVDLNIFSKRNPVYLYFRNQEKQLYKISDFIGCMSPANVRYVKEHNKYLDESKIHISPNCIIPSDNFKTASDHNGLKLIYGGNLGKPQGIDFIIECCKVIEQIDGVEFTIIGSGTEYDKLKNAVTGFKGTKLIPFLPKNEYLKCMREHDMGMIFLDSHFEIPNFPSRVLDYLDNGLPVFACTDKNSDIKQEICDAGAGIWSESNSLEDFSINLRKILNDKTVLLPMKDKAGELLRLKYNALTESENICKKIKTR